MNRSPDCPGRRTAHRRAHSRSRPRTPGAVPLFSTLRKAVNVVLEKCNGAGARTAAAVEPRNADFPHRTSASSPRPGALSVAHRPSADPALQSVGPAPASTRASGNAGARPGPRTPASTAAAGAARRVVRARVTRRRLTAGLLNPKARWPRRTSQSTQPARPSSRHGRRRAAAYRVVTSSSAPSPATGPCVADRRPSRDDRGPSRRPRSIPTVLHSDA